MFVASRWVIQGAIRVKVHRIGVHMQRPVFFLFLFFFFCNSHALMDGRTNALDAKVAREERKKTEAQISDSEESWVSDGWRSGVQGEAKRRRSMLCVGTYLLLYVRARAKSLSIYRERIRERERERDISPIAGSDDRYLLLSLFLSHETQIQLIISTSLFFYPLYIVSPPSNIILVVFLLR